MKIFWISLLLYLVKEGYSQGLRCDHIFMYTGDSTTIQSHPGYPYSDYHNHMFHCWKVEGPPNVHFSLWTEDFDLEYDEDCQYDFMEIRCGSEGGTIGRYCGTQGVFSPVYTGGNEVIIVLRTDSTEVERGFELNVRAIGNNNDLLSDCNGDYSSDDYSWESWEDFDDDDDSWEKHHKNAELAARTIIGIVIAVVALVIVIPCIIACVVCGVITRRNRFGGARPIVQTYPQNNGQAIVMTTQNAGYPVQQPNVSGYTPPNVSGGYAPPNGYGYPAAGNIAQPPAYQPAGAPEKNTQAPPPEYYSVIGSQGNATPAEYDNKTYSEVQ